MIRALRYGLISLAYVSLTGLITLAGEPAATPYWNIDELRIGQKGYGLTVMKGVKRERFDAEVLGVLKNTSPGRDLVLCRLAGLDLERSGIIAGMSGSPVYVDDKLVGAVAYAWAYGKDPIAGVTPFSQMRSFAESIERRNMAAASKAVRVALSKPVRVDGRIFDAVSVSQRTDANRLNDSELAMIPLQAPVSTSGFSANALRMLRDQFPDLGVVPVQGGVVSGKILDEAKNARIEPGAALTVALIDGDFDMSGIGTVTHVEGQRVYGWGHPFMSLGGCELPLMTGWVHTIYPRQSVSFKMGSPLKSVGVINNDVSTCIAGWLGREADMLPVTMKVRHEFGGSTNEFKVRVVRQKQMLPALVYAALTNSIDMEGELPEEMTISFTCRIEIEGREPIVIKDTFAGSAISGNRAPAMLYNPVSGLISTLLNHSFKPVRITRIDCDTEIRAGRDAAEIEGVELSADSFEPGDVVRANVWIRPYRGKLIKVPLTLKLPSDLPEGSYPISISDELTNARQELRSRPELNMAMDEVRLMEALRLLTTARRTVLVARLPLPASGVAIEGEALTNLPAGMVQLLSQSRRAPVHPISAAVVGKESTPWVIYGSSTVRITVSNARRPNVMRD